MVPFLEDGACENCEVFMVEGLSSWLNDDQQGWQGEHVWTVTSSQNHWNQFFSLEEHLDVSSMFNHWDCGDYSQSMILVRVIISGNTRNSKPIAYTFMGW